MVAAALGAVHPLARRLDALSPDAPDLERWAAEAGGPDGSGGMATKIAATRIATRCGIPVVITRAGDADVAVRVRVVDVEEPVRAEARMEREREEPLLVAGGHLIGDVEVGLVRELPVLEHADASGLLDDVETGLVARRRGGQTRIVSAPARRVS